MKILHFSDFHLNQASNSLLKSQGLIEQMISALKRNEMERTIDLVLFTGDMVDVGGKSFCSIRQGFESFVLTSKFLLHHLIGYADLIISTSSPILAPVTYGPNSITFVSFFGFLSI